MDSMVSLIHNLQDRDILYNFGGTYSPLERLEDGIITIQEFQARCH